MDVINPVITMLAWICTADSFLLSCCSLTLPVSCAAILTHSLCPETGPACTVVTEMLSGPGDNLYPLFGPGRTVVAHKAAPGDGLRPLSGNHTRKSGATGSERAALSAHPAMGQGTCAAGQTVLSEQPARCLTGPETQGAARSISGLAITWLSHKHQRSCHHLAEP